MLYDSLEGLHLVDRRREREESGLRFHGLR